MTGLCTAAAVVEAIRGCRFRWSSEQELQRGLAGALEAAGYTVAREVPLNAHNRIDFLIERVGIEVKTSGGWRDVDRQLQRYLTSPLLDELVLVTARARHRRIPPSLATSKRLIVHQLEVSGL